VHNLLAVVRGARAPVHEPTLLPARLVVRESTAQRTRHRRHLPAAPPQGN